MTGTWWQALRRVGALTAAVIGVAALVAHWSDWGRDSGPGYVSVPTTFSQCNDTIAAAEGMWAAGSNHPTDAQWDGVSVTIYFCLPYGFGQVTTGSSPGIDVTPTRVAVPASGIIPVTVTVAPGAEGQVGFTWSDGGSTGGYAVDVQRTGTGWRFRSRDDE